MAELSAIDALVAESRLRPISRVSFIRRALALGLPGPAAAALLAEVEGPAPAHAASTVQIAFSSWGSLDEQITITAVLKAFTTRYPNIQVQPLLTSWSNYWP